MTASRILGVELCLDCLDDRDYYANLLLLDLFILSFVVLLHNMFIEDCRESRMKSSKHCRKEVFDLGPSQNAVLFMVNKWLNS